MTCLHLGEWVGESTQNGYSNDKPKTPIRTNYRCLPECSVAPSHVSLTELGCLCHQNNEQVSLATSGSAKNQWNGNLRCCSRNAMGVLKWIWGAATGICEYLMTAHTVVWCTEDWGQEAMPNWAPFWKVNGHFDQSKTNIRVHGGHRLGQGTQGLLCTVEWGRDLSIAVLKRSPATNPGN